MYKHFNFKKSIVLFIPIAFLIIAFLSVSSYKAQPDEKKEEPTNENVSLPIIMYHGLIKEKSLQNKYMIQPELFESDLKYLKNKGYNTIFMKDLIDYVYNDKDLPSKPIMITFDDGYYNNYLYAFPLLKKYNSKMVLSPIGICTEKYSNIEDTHASYAYVSWNNVNEMVNSGLVEIQNHSYNMHHNSNGRCGTTKKKGETIENYRKVLTTDIEKMQAMVKENVGIEPTTFTYPFGGVSKESLDVLKEMGFKATLICEYKTNKISKNPECLYGLGRFLRPNKMNSQEYFNRIVKLEK